MSGPGKEYTIGKGKLYFDIFATGLKVGEGERYFGNTPEISVTKDSEALDHFDADEGLNVKDESVTLENTQTLSFSCDNMETKNVALWFQGDETLTTIAAPIAAQTDELEVKRGHWYQLGVTEARPSGVRKITGVTVTDDAGSPVTIPAGNYELDAARGRIYIESDAADVADGDTIIVNYTIGVQVRSTIIGAGDEIRGALRYVSANPVGPQRDYFWPYVKITPNGDFALKSDEWMSMSFSVEVLKRDAATAPVYVDGVPA